MDDINSESSAERAKLMHDVWAHWMRYQLSICPDGVIPPDKLERWTRLANTEFDDLTEEEKASDYEVAARYMRAGRGTA